VFRLVRKFSERLLSDVKRDYEVYGSDFWVMENIRIFGRHVLIECYGLLKSDLRGDI
jgi:hypothetical protein